MFTHLPNGQNIDYNYLINFDMQENSKYSFSETDSTIPFKNTFPRIAKLNACFAYFSMHFCNVYQSIFLLPKTDYRISRLQIESAKVALNFESSNNRHNLMWYCIAAWKMKNTNRHIGIEKIFSDVIYTAKFVFFARIDFTLFVFIHSIRNFKNLHLFAGLFHCSNAHTIHARHMPSNYYLFRLQWE